MSLTDTPPPYGEYQGHVLQSFQDLEGGHAKCLKCGWKATMAESLEPGFQVPLCPESPEGRMAQELEPEEFTEAQSLGLVVASAMTQAHRERDQARELAVRLEQDLARALEALDATVAAWPETSWAQDSLAKEKAQEVLAELRDPDRPA